jgi:hypothetical protein
MRYEPFDQAFVALSSMTTMVGSMPIRVRTELAM